MERKICRMETSGCTKMSLSKFSIHVMLCVHPRVHACRSIVQCSVYPTVEDALVWVNVEIAL